MREYIGADPLAFVLSLNLKRRQLSASELAFVALEIEKYEAGEAKKRQAAKGLVLALMPEVDKGEARDKAAAAFRVPRVAPPSQARAGVTLQPVPRDRRQAPRID